MIVCKITADFDSAAGDFSGFFDTLTPLGAVLSVDDSIFFGSSDASVDKKKIKRLLKKYGYEESIVLEYGVASVPHETPMINGWIYDRVSQNAIMRLGQEHQEAIKKGMKQLDEIDSIVNAELSKIPTDDEKKEGTEVS